MSVNKMYVLLFLLIGHTSPDAFYSPSPGILKFAAFINSSSLRACSGTIVSPRWVLTAASCVYKMNQVTVYAGMVDYGKYDKMVQSRVGKQINIHPEYKAGLAGHDLALIQVSDFEFNSNVNKVDLTDQGWIMDKTQDKRSCVSFGFGDWKDSNTKLKMWNSSALYGGQGCPCLKRFQWRRLLCAERQKDAGLCGQGDLGSGLVCYDGEYPFNNPTNKNNMSVFGVAHMMININKCKSKFEFLYNAKCEDMETMSTYMYLCPYLNWVSQYVEGSPAQPPTCRASTVHPCTVVVVLILWSIAIV